jgi:hypothetical protein
MVVSSPTVGSDTVDRYKATFRAPLSPTKEEALQTLFGDDFDPVAMNLDMIGVVEVEA